MIDWKAAQVSFEMAMAQEKTGIYKNWYGHTGMTISYGFCMVVDRPDGERIILPKDTDVKDIYKIPEITEEWNKLFSIDIPGPQRLRDVIVPMTAKEIRRSKPVNITKDTDIMRFAGNPLCPNMYPKIYEVIEHVMRSVIRDYPRPGNNAFVWGDAGCWPGKSCPNHSGAHNDWTTVDIDYCTTGHNCTHYGWRLDLPIEKLWNDTFPYRSLKKEVFDTDKNNAFFERIETVFVGNNETIKVNTGIYNHLKQLFGDSCTNYDDTEIWCHHKHAHIYLQDEINWDAVI